MTKSTREGQRVMRARFVGIVGRTCEEKGVGFWIGFRWIFSVEDERKWAFLSSWEEEGDKGTRDKGKWYGEEKRGVGERERGMGSGNKN